MQDTLAFATEWCAAWNAHDLDRLLAHFHEDVVFTSPFAARVLPETAGFARGKAALRAYWAFGLQQIPDLAFTVEQVFAGVDALTIKYRNQRGGLASEVLVFEGERVKAGYATYLVEAGS